jgi:signal transduction histidine kinase
MSVYDASSDPRFQYREAAKREGIASVLCVPLRLRGRPTGVLRIYTAAPRRFSDSELRVLMTFAAVAALAIHNAEHHAEVLQYLRKAAHELRSPMAAVRSMVDVVSQGFVGDVAENQRQILGRARSRIDTLLESVNDILALSQVRMTSGMQPPASVRMDQVVRQVIDLQTPQAETKELELQIDLPADPVQVRAERQLLEELTANLLSNAIKYTPRGGCVRVGGHVDNGVFELKVEDTGIGIPEEDLPALGTEFKRASNARGSDIPGTGLGLSIVQGILERYSGQMSISSELGKGTQVEVRLPVVGDRTRS